MGKCCLLQKAPMVSSATFLSMFSSVLNLGQIDHDVNLTGFDLLRQASLSGA